MWCSLSHNSKRAEVAQKSQGEKGGLNVYWFFQSSSFSQSSETMNTGGRGLVFIFYSKYELALGFVSRRSQKLYRSRGCII